VIAQGYPLEVLWQPDEQRNVVQAGTAVAVHRPVERWSLVVGWAEPSDPRDDGLAMVPIVASSGSDRADQWEPVRELYGDQVRRFRTPDPKLTIDIDQLQGWAQDPLKVAVVNAAELRGDRP
jgi:hypothetical protein